MKKQLCLWSCAVAVIASYACGSEGDGIDSPSGLVTTACFRGVDNSGDLERATSSSSAASSIIEDGHWVRPEPPCSPESNNVARRPETAGKKNGDVPPAFVLSPPYSPSDRSPSEGEEEALPLPRAS